VKDPILLLTSTISPHSLRSTVRADAVLRRQDYLIAFERWVKESNFSTIVFCENSGAALGEFEEIGRASGKRVELLSFDAPVYPEHRGKAYGELLAIEYALRHSKIIRANSRILKCTGRLFLHNHKKFYWHGVHGDFDLSIDLDRTLDSCDVRAFYATPSFFEHYVFPLRDRLDEMANPPQLLESIVAQGMLRSVSDLAVYAPLPCAAGYVGYSGSLGHKYSRVQSTIGRLIRVVPPQRLRGSLFTSLMKLRIQLLKR
jgi:hypothetical protein